MRFDELQKFFTKAIAPLKRKVLTSISRGIVSAINSGDPIQLSSVSIFADEAKDKAEVFQQFGFTSALPSKTECVIVAVGGNREHSIIIASENREFRLKGLDSGDSAQYNMNGKFIKLVGDDCEMLLEKFKIENSSHEMISVLSEFMDEVILGKTITLMGPQPWDPATIIKLQAVKDKLDTFKA